MKNLEYLWKKLEGTEEEKEYLENRFNEMSVKEQYILEGKDISALLNKVLKRSSTSIIERHLFGSNSSFLSETANQSSNPQFATAVG